MKSNIQVDSFVGTHMLAELLAGDASTEVFILGTDKPAEHRHVIASFEHYRLFSGGVDNNKKLTPAALVARTRCLPGALSQPRLGLDAHAFRALGEQIHAIYHFGTQVSLLKRYRDLKRVNVDASRDMIELAGVRSAHATHIHCLSTWSVPHLQTWPASRRRRQQQQQQQQHTGQAIEARDGASGTGNSSDSSSTVVAAEVAATHFTPEPTDDFAYVKGRWAAEQLFVQAAARGFAVSIYRASALTASTATRVPEPPCDFVRCLVLSMVRLAVVPLLPTPQAWQRAQAYEQAQGPPSSHSLHAHSPDEFVIDFIPVNYATSVLYKLSRTTRASSNGESATGTGMGTETGTAARFFHITNPQPLPLRRLAGLIGRIRGDGVSAREVAPDEWLRLLQASPSAAFSTSSSPPPASSLLSPLSPLSPSSSSSSLLPTTSAAANAECCVNTATKVNARANANADPDADDADSEANSTMRCSVVRAYIEKQHCMFALDTTRTQRQLRMLRGEGGSGDGDDATTATTTITTTAASAGASASDNVFSCPAVDADFLGRMFFGR
jgi:thioester reductase-like protein